MPIQFVLEDQRCLDMVSKVLTLVSKFSRKEAYIKLGSRSVTVIWKQNNNTNVWARVDDASLFRTTPNLRTPHHHIVILANPSTLARLLKGAAQQNKKVTINIHKERNRMRIIIEPLRRDNINGARTVTHTVAATHQSSDTCSTLQLDDLRMDNNYDTRAVINEMYRIRHILERFLVLNPPRIYIWTKHGGDLTLRSDTMGSDIVVSISDLENGFPTQDDANIEYNRRDEAGVYVETKKLATFLTHCNPSKKAKVCFEVAHNKKLRLTVDYDNYYIMFVLAHNLN